MKKLIKESYIPKLLKEIKKEDKVKAKKTCFLIMKGLDEIEYVFKLSKIFDFLKELQIYSIGKEMMKIFENEEEYSKEDILSIKNLIIILEKYFRKKDFYEHKNEILNIIDSGQNVINNKRNDHLNSRIIFFLGYVFEKIKYS